MCLCRGCLLGGVLFPLINLFNQWQLLSHLCLPAYFPCVVSVCRYLLPVCWNSVSINFRFRKGTDRIFLINSNPRLPHPVLLGLSCALFGPVGIENAVNSKCCLISSMCAS